jgi:hypothetical protein
MQKAEAKDRAFSETLFTEIRLISENMGRITFEH